MADSKAFGTWLRQKRKALDLSRHDLAQRAACAAITIEKIEVGQRRPSKQVAAALAVALRIPDAEREAFVAFARGQAPGPDGDGAPALCPHNLLELPSALIGRDDERRAIWALLGGQRFRIVTLTGPGGVGKTALALDAAWRCARQGLGTPGADDEAALPGGVAFVSLAPVADAAHVATAIAQSVAAVLDESQALASFDALKERLRDRPMLIVLDNFEHVSAAAPRVAELAAACPRLRILVTSRVGLGLSGGRDLAIAPLPRAAAAALFLARAKEANPHFTPVDAAAQAIDALCRLLDGLPLAIELVAARAKLMSPQAILARLTAGDRLHIDLIADGISDLPARQRTLRSAIAWSYDLLTPVEQRSFRRLAVFVGGCGIEAAEAVLAGAATLSGGVDGSTVDHWNALSQLLNKSLVKREDADGADASEPRFTMLETVREFALERLRASGVDADAAALRHAQFFAAFARDAAPHLNGPQPSAWLRRVAQEQGNLRAAMLWQLNCDAPEALRMCAALGPYWHTSGLYHEGLRALRAALEQPANQAPSAARAAGLYWLGRISRRVNAWADALRHAEESVALYRAVGDERGLAQAILGLGWATYSQVGCAEAARWFEQGLALYRRLDDPRGTAQALLDLAHVVTEHDVDYDRATHYLLESRALFRRLGDDEGQALVSTAMGNIAGLRGEYALSRAHLLDGLVGFQRAGAQGFVAGQFLDLGEASYFLGDLATAEQEWQMSLRLHREHGTRVAVARTQFQLARLRRSAGRVHEAIELLHSALATFRGSGRDRMAARCVAAMGGIALIRGQCAQAAMLLGAAQRYFDGAPSFLAPADVAEHQRDIDACRRQLSADAFARAWAEGQAMALDAACDRALEI